MSFGLYLVQIMRDEILELQSCHATTMAKMAEYRRNLIHLSHRVLKVGILPFHIIQAEFFKPRTAVSAVNPCMCRLNSLPKPS